MTSPTRTPRDMALSLLVLLVPIFLLGALLQYFRGGDGAVVVDPAAAVALARSAKAFPVSAPEGLGPGWRPVSATFRDATLRIGYLTPSGAGAQFVQSGTPADTLLPAELGDRARHLGAEDVGGRTWQRYEARGGENAYVLLEPDRTVMVIGATGVGELHTLAAAMR